MTAPISVAKDWLMAAGVDRSVLSQTYLHYKGGRYLLLAVTERHTHNGDCDAVYVSLMTGKLITRPYHRDSRDEDSFTDVVDWPDGQRRPRFMAERLLPARSP